MTVLVTGGAGFIGSHLVRRLAQEGSDVVVLDNLSSGRISNLRSCLDGGHVTFVEGDIRDAKIVHQCVKEVDTIAHLAAIASVPYANKNPEEAFDVNAAGTLNLLEAASAGNVERFVYASTCAVYGEPREIPTKEDHPLAANSTYGKSKMTGEQFCRDIRQRYGFETVSLRLFNVYGPPSGNGGAGVVGKFAEKLRRGEPLPVYGDGEQTRDFIHVEDAVEAIHRTTQAASLTADTYNVGTGQAVSIVNLAQVILRLCGRDWERPTFEPSRLGEIRRSRADISRIRGQLGFNPIISLEQGLRSIVGSLKTGIEVVRKSSL